MRPERERGDAGGRSNRKLACSNIAWGPEADEMAAGVLRSFGLSGVEIAPTRVWARPAEVPAEAAAAHRAFWEDRGLQVVALQALLYGRPELMLFGTDAQRRALQEHLERQMVLASRLGAQVLVFGGPAQRRRGSLLPVAALDVAVRFFRNVAARAEEHEVVLCIEPNPPAYGCDFITTAAEGAELVRRVDHPGFFLHLDAGALTVAGDTPDTVSTHARLLRHFHVSEAHLVALGKGGIDHVAWGKALRSADYDGWVSLEMRRDPSGDDRRLLERALPLLCSCYG